MSDWIDATALGSRYETQFNPRTDEWRHREQAFKMPRNIKGKEPFDWMDDLPETEAPWTYGLPPDRQD